MFCLNICMYHVIGCEFLSEVCIRGINLNYIQ